MPTPEDELDLLRVVRLCAWGAVHHNEDDYYLRHIFRWYSREFHTPLHLVEDLPLVDVLTHFYECQYEELKDEERLQQLYEEEALRLRETKAESAARAVREAEQEVEDMAFLKEAQEEAKRNLEAARLAAAAPKPVPAAAQPGASIGMKFPPEGQLVRFDRGDWNLLGKDED